MPAPVPRNPERAAILGVEIAYPCRTVHRLSHSISHCCVCTNLRTGVKGSFSLTRPTRCGRRSGELRSFSAKDLTAETYRRQNDFSKCTHEMEDQVWLRPHKYRR